MKIAVMGAGAVGCYYGAMLAKAGHAVTLVGRPGHVAAMTSRGLLLEIAGAKHACPVQADTGAQAVAGAELVLVCVKSADTLQAAAEMRPHLAAEACILSLQNGVDNAERLQGALDRPVVAAAVYVAAEMAGPGHVRHHGRGDLVIGDGPSSLATAELFRAAAIPTTVSGQVAGELWTKLVVNCAINAVSAITQIPYGRMMAAEGSTAVFRAIVAECSDVAAGLGIALPDDILGTALRIGETMPSQTSSTAQDVARGKPSEIDYLNGYVLRQGEALGLPMPANRLLVYLVKLIEAERAATPRRSGTAS